MADTLTKNFKFVKPQFNKKPWQQNFYDAMDAIDAILARYILVSNFVGVWNQATAYTATQRVVDTVGGAIYTCNVSHTSTAINTFAQDRIANPTFWTIFTFSVQFRGTWLAQTDYSTGDFVVFGQRLAVANSTHHSSNSFVTDQANGLWNVLIDGTAVVALPTGTAANADQVIRYDGASLQYQLAPNTVKLSSTGVLTLPAGAAGAPTLSINSQGGLFSPGANLVAISAGGIEIMRLKSDGTTTLAFPDLFRQGAGFPAAAAANAGMVLGWDTGGSNLVNLGPLASQNRTINGDFKLAQRINSQAGITTTQYSSVDRFAINIAVATPAFTQSQDGTDHPIFAATGAGFSFKTQVTTADAVVAAAKAVFISHRYEGYNVSDITTGNKGTLTFWCKSPKTGIHCVSFTSSNGDRSYVVEFTVNAANTWERKTITVDFANAQAAGTWNQTNGAGLCINWTLMAGSNFQGAAGAWTTANLFATANQQNLVDTIGNIFKLADVDFRLGSVAPPLYERRIYTLERLLCQRYYFKTYDDSLLPGTATTNGYRYMSVGTAGTGQFALHWQFPVPMRASPTVTLYAPSSGASANVDRGGVADPAGFVTGQNANGVSVGSNGVSSVLAFSFQATASAEL